MEQSSLEPSKLVETDTPCSGCGTNLRGHGWDGDCPECGLKVERSMRVAAARVGDAAQLGRLATGLQVQGLSEKLSLLVLVTGALLLAAGMYLPMAAMGIGAILGIAGTLLMFRFWQDCGWGTFHEQASRGRRVAVAVGSGALALCSVSLTLRYSARITPMMWAAFMLCGVCWYAGEISKLHFIQRIATDVRDGRTYRQARSLRWGMFALLVAFAASLLLSFPGAGIITPALFLMLATTALILFSLLTSATCRRASRVVQQQAMYTELVERGDVLIQGEQSGHSVA